MKILFVNTTCGRGSHGKICVQLAKQYIEKGNQCRIAYGRDTIPEETKEIAKPIGGRLSVYSHIVLTRAFDCHGFGSYLATKKFIQWVEKYNPDLVWFHNLHGYYINVKLLFDWVKSRPEMEVKWTLHDCWPFTGHCTNFESCGCNRWKTGCHNCIQKKEYPKSVIFDFSKKNYLRKKEVFLGIHKMTLYTPSEWLANRVKKSFLYEYPIEVMPNPIDAEIFKKRESDFRELYHLNDKFIILGVANAWQKSKGLYDFFALSQLLDNTFVVVLVGLNEKQMKMLPAKVIGITKIANAIKLAEVYSAADVFVNPSKEETFGMTVLEALSCGTPAIVYRGTACEEIAHQYGGIVIEDNVKALREEVCRMKRGIRN